MEVEFRCAHCQSVNEIREDARVLCAACGKSYGVHSDFVNDQNAIQRCAICGCRDLFIQKDFNRKIGCGIAILGAVLAPFTRLISLFVCAAIDLILYLILPVITICYKCGTIYRDFQKNPAHESFNLGINDRYRADERK